VDLVGPTVLIMHFVVNVDYYKVYKRKKFCYSVYFGRGKFGTEMVYWLVYITIKSR
jgi:hypothetical protein